MQRTVAHGKLQEQVVDAVIHDEHATRRMPVAPPRATRRAVVDAFAHGEPKDREHMRMRGGGGGAGDLQ